MRFYMLNQEGNELSVMMTEACNSCCIMCPMSPGARQRGYSLSEAELSEVEALLTPTLRHIDITGGEPFLQWGMVIQLMQMINVRCPAASVLVLTNGRALALPQIQAALRPVITTHYQFAVPVHADQEALHDRITQAPGSFRETMDGLRFLSGTCASIEIRIVGSLLNADRIPALADRLLKEKLRIHTVNLIAMEMHGSAAFNREQLWIDYDKLFALAQPGLVKLMMNGVNTALYDFPLCCVPRGYWALAQRSISEWKVCYPAGCAGCTQQAACGGLFDATARLNLCQVKPFKGR